MFELANLFGLFSTPYLFGSVFIVSIFTQDLMLTVEVVTEKPVIISDKMENNNLCTILCRYSF